MARSSARNGKDPNFDGTVIETRPGDLGLCAHEVPDDQDCVECRTNRCSGGGDCDCRPESNVMLRTMKTEY